jgi:hypothetical protein
LRQIDEKSIADERALLAERDRYRNELEEVVRDGLPVLREVIAERDRYRKVLEDLRDLASLGGNLDDALWFDRLSAALSTEQ